MSYEQEFMVVDVVLLSDAPTRGVDAFTLAVVKMERQIRKLFTHLVFQSDTFNEVSVEALRASLGAEKHFYFEGIERGVNALFRLTVADLIGNEFGSLLESVDYAIQYRNKILHRQLTDRCLRREDLIKVVDGVRRWCKALAMGAERENRLRRLRT
ncbi:hypothetical protein [Caballeronia sp. dw_276]|uniref:hypothetical protein n=1 Tax=Caballeronia sp. dw_276 TaxID=2719795 RepID=UPI001BD56CF2|nr:hypothetical protein [Caballeronia sp. dw_276]